MAEETAVSPASRPSRTAEAKGASTAKGASPAKGGADVSGVLLLDKAPGWTSHDAVARVRRVFGTRRVGHTGTLDPAATGLLVVTLGACTRIGRFLEAEAKTYDATVRLGVATDTLDAEGAVVETAPVPALTGEEVRGAVATLVGPQTQTIPVYSAVKRGGEPLYKKARRGEAVAAPTRAIVVHECALRRWACPEIELSLRVSKGTYVRSLALELGRRLGVPAHLSALRRTSVGAMSVADAVPVAELAGPVPLLEGAQALGAMPRLLIGARGQEMVRRGQRVPWRLLAPQNPEVMLDADQPVALIGPDGGLAAVAQTLRPCDGPGTDGDTFYRYLCVLLRNR